VSGRAASPGRGLLPWVAFGTGLLVLLLSSFARAEYRHRVVLLEPPNAEGSLEVRARLRGELSAAGFDVITLQVASIDDPKRTSETAARELQPAAVLFIVEPQGPADQILQASIWLSDRLLRRTFVLTYSVDPADPGRDSARVAVQVAEILKADLAELSVTRAEKPKPLPDHEPPPLPPPPPPPPSRLGDGVRLEAGVALLQGFDGFGASLTPVARLGATLPASWFRRAPLSLDVVLAAAAFGGTVRTRHEADAATLRQGVGTLTIAARFVPTFFVQPMVTASTGAYRVAWAGSATAPRVADAGRTWSGVSGGGAGLWIQPTGGFAATLQGEVLAAWSRTVLRFGGEPVASAGSPMLLVSAAAVGVF
jgi:hypothetical protein